MKKDGPMKLLKYTLGLLLVLVIWLDIFAYNATQITIGGSNANDAEGKTGLALDYEYWGEINYLFAWGLNIGWNWYKWERYVRDEDGAVIYYEDEPVTEVAHTILYPIMFGARIQYPLNDIFTPFIGGGMGWNFMYLVSSRDTTPNWYNGFSWQVQGGTSIAIFNFKRLRLVTELKYRESLLKNTDNVEVDMSGLQYTFGIEYGNLMHKR